LGPFEVRRDGVVLDVGPPQQRAVIVALLLRANRVVSTDQLIDALWDDAPPASARHSLHVYVRNLRRVLEPEASGPPQVLVTRPPGYSLVIDPDRIDASRFEHLADRGRKLLETDPVAAEAVLREALAEWRDEPFADVVDERITSEAVGHLNEVRIRATEDLVDAQLALGRHLEVVEAIEPIVRANPFRERLWGQWILTLYRCGRQAEALRVFQQLRTTLRDELGVEPSRELRDLELAVLDQDPRLDLVREAQPSPPPPPAEPAEPMEPIGPSTPVEAEAAVPAPRRRRWPFAAAASIAIVASLATSDVLPLHADPVVESVAAAPTYTARYAPVDCTADVKASVPGATCGMLSVPEDRTHPDHRWIDLTVMRAPARTDHPTDDPTVLVNDGINPLETQATTPTRDHSDLVTFPTRLSFAPNPAMECPENAALNAKVLLSPLHDPDVSEQVRTAFHQCYQRLVDAGVALDHYTADEAAEDVADLARALGIPRMNLVSEADAGLVPFQVIKHHRDLVRTLTLQNPIAPGRSEGDSDTTAELARAFDKYVALCQADARCNRAYPDLAQDLRDDWDYWVDHPTVTNASNGLGEPIPIRFDGDRTAEAVGEGLANRSALPIVAAFIGHRPRNGMVDPQLDAQTNALPSSAALLFEWWSANPHVPLATAMSDWCGYEFHTIQPFRQLSNRARPELAGVDTQGLENGCPEWPVPKAPDDEFTPLVSDVPTFILEGELSMWSSPEWVGMLRNGLSHTTSLLFPTLGAGVIGEGIPSCINDLRRQFLADPSVSLDVDGCVKQSPPIDFVVDTP
jgi:DNA-binding SARP family transcriptional activator